MFFAIVYLLLQQQTNSFTRLPTKIYCLSGRKSIFSRHNRLAIDDSNKNSRIQKKAFEKNDLHQRKWIHRLNSSQNQRTSEGPHPSRTKTNMAEFRLRGRFTSKFYIWYHFRSSASMRITESRLRYQHVKFEKQNFCNFWIFSSVCDMSTQRTHAFSYGNTKKTPELFLVQNQAFGHFSPANWIKYFFWASENKIGLKKNLFGHQIINFLNIQKFHFSGRL